MPNSLRCRIKKWCYQGVFNEKDRDRLINGLDCADALQEIRQEIDNWHHLTDKAFNDGIDTALEIIDKHIKGIE